MKRYFCIPAKHYLIQVTAILLLVLCLPVVKSYAFKSDSIDKICQLSPSECLEKVNIELKSTKQKSRIWFRLMQFKLSSLFILQHSNELYQETKRWIHDEDLPIPFQVTLYMYYAKSLLSNGELEEGMRYIYKAKQQLALMNEAYPAPIKLIEIANLQMYIGEYSEAYASLLTLKDKYKNSHNPHFMMELYAHLGHVARNLGYFDEELAHWHKTLPWSYKFGNEQQIATVYFNLARSQHNLKQYSLAEKSYLSSIEHAKIALDVAKASHAKLHLAEIKLIMGSKNQAKALLSSFDETLLSQHYLTLYKSLKSKL